MLQCCHQTALSSQGGLRQPAYHNTQDAQNDLPAASATSGRFDDTQEIPPTPAKTAKDEPPDFPDDYQETEGKNSETALGVPHMSEVSAEASPPNSKPLSGTKAHSSKSAESTSHVHITPAKIPKMGDVKAEISPPDVNTSGAKDPAGRPPSGGPAICSSCFFVRQPRLAEGTCHKCNKNPVCSKCKSKYYCWDCCALAESYDASKDPRFATEAMERVTS